MLKKFFKQGLYLVKDGQTDLTVTQHLLLAHI